MRRQLAEDLNEEATEDLKQDVREAEAEEAKDADLKEELKADPDRLTKSRLLKLLVKKQYLKLREVTEDEQPPTWPSCWRNWTRTTAWWCSVF